MKRVAYICFFVCAVLGSERFVFGQAVDTLVVYDYVHVTDTVWIEEPVRLQTMNLINFKELSFFQEQDPQSQEEESLHFSANTEFNCLASTGSIGWTQFRDHLNFFVKANAAMQTHWVDKTYGKDGEFPILTAGLGVGSKYNVNRWLVIEPKLAFIQKGCQLGYLYDTINSKGITKTKIGYEGYQNRFNYLSADLILKIGKNSSTKFGFHLYGGLRGDVLLWDKIEYHVDVSPYSSLESMASDTEYENFRRFNYGWVAGLGTEVKNKWFIQFEVNSDIGYAVKAYSFRAQNLMASINAGVYLNQ